MAITNSFTEFLNPILSIENMAIYFTRKSIFNASTEHIRAFHGTQQDISCDEMPYKQYILSDSKVEKHIGLYIENPIYQQNTKPDMFWDGDKIPLDENRVDTIMATELFEHLPHIEPVLNEINRVLKSRELLLKVPFLWPLHDTPQDEYFHTPFALERQPKSTNFTAISINALGGWNPSLAQMISLWLKRSGLAKEQKDHFSRDLFPFYNYLLKMI
jgi:hypothetical protein